MQFSDFGPVHEDLKPFDEMVLSFIILVYAWQKSTSNLTLCSVCNKLCPY